MAQLVDLAVGGYHYEPNLTYTGDSGTELRTDDWGAVYATSLGNLMADAQARYLRYSVNAGSPHWGYVFELMVDGHSPVITDPNVDTGSGGAGGSVTGGNTVPEPSALALLGLGLGLMGWTARRKY